MYALITFATGNKMENEIVKKTPFIKRFFKWIWRNIWWVIGVLIICGLLCWWLCPGAAKKHGYITMDVVRGNITQVVTASGEIQPVNTVNVGSQVSGTIEDIFVDYNSRVKKGDILLKIEPSVLQSTVDESRASLESAKSELKYAKSEFERNQSLYNDGFISRAEMEKSQTVYEQAIQSVNKLQYSYERAITNLGYA
nr:biotin/lipoyl-binding protein [Candidatus Enterousia merdequi]